MKRLHWNRRAVELDPLSAEAQFYVGVAALYAGRLEEAAAGFTKALELNPVYPSTMDFLRSASISPSRSRNRPSPKWIANRRSYWRLYGQALAYHALGRKKEADAALAELTRE